MRKGEVGDFKNYFDSKELHDQFNNWIRAGTTETDLKFDYGDMDGNEE